MNVVLLLIGFWSFQLIANFFFKFGSDHKGFWWHCLIIGNLFGASSIWFTMKMYQHMNANLFGAIGGGITFILVQLLFVVVFHSRPSLIAWIGILVVFIGVMLTTIGGPQQEQPHRYQPASQQRATPAIATMNAQADTPHNSSRPH